MICMLFSQDPCHVFVIHNNCKYRQHHLYIALHASYLFTDIFKVFPFFLLSSCLLSFTSLFLTLFKYKSILCTHKISRSFFLHCSLNYYKFSKGYNPWNKIFSCSSTNSLSVCLSFLFSLSSKIINMISKQH